MEALTSLFQSFLNLFTSLIDYILGGINGFVKFLSLVPRFINLAITFASGLPDWLIPWITFGIFITVVLMFLPLSQN